MNGAETLPQYWRSIRSRSPRPPIDWRAVATVAALGIGAGALVFSGAVAHGFGMTLLGDWMMAAGAGLFVLASFVRV